MDKISEIRNIPHVKDVTYTTERYIGKLDLEPSKKTFTTGELINEINKARIEKNYFMSLSYSWTIIEEYVKQILLKRSKGSNTSLNIDELALDAQINLLDFYENLPKPMYNNLLELVHVLYRNYYYALEKHNFIGFSSEEEAKTITSNALNCAKFLMTKYDSLSM